jgi:hypothetical protein
MGLSGVGVKAGLRGPLLFERGRAKVEEVGDGRHSEPRTHMETLDRAGWYLPAATAIVLLMPSCTSPHRSTEPKTDDAHAQAPPASMKGWEIYPLRSRGQGSWSFALLPGTNRIKTREEILEVAVGTDPILRALARMPEGETLIWMSFPDGGTPPGPVPEELLGPIREVSQARRMKIIGSPTASGIP